jgi:hypothetical protein
MACCYLFSAATPELISLTVSAANFVIDDKGGLEFKTRIN